MRTRSGGGTLAVHPPLTHLVQRVRSVVARGLGAADTADLVGQYLRPTLQVTGLLTDDHREGSAEDYTQHLLHVEPDGSFSVVALVWLPGQSTAVHDHVSWCTVGVYEGEETEVLYRLAGGRGRRYLTEAGSTVNRPGDVSACAPPGDVHRVFNSGAAKAVSLHVYGADVARLGSSINRTYDEQDLTGHPRMPRFRR